jgi:alginate O-acetyltransferase complex protein AlgJ
MTPSPAPSRRLTDAILIAIFVVAVSLPLIGQTMGLGGPTGKPQTVPPLRTAEASAWTFPDRFNTYYSDQFAFRPSLIRWHAKAKYLGLGVSPSETAMIGKDGWLYYAGDNCLDDYHTTLLTEPELAKWTSVMQARRDWLAARNIRFLVVLVPDKHIVYPDYLPDAVHRAPGPYRMDQLADHLRRHSTIEVLNLRPALEEARKTERIYHKTDSHWNDRGALVGYREIMNRVSAWFPNTKPLDRSAFTPVARLGPGWDLTEMLGLQDVILEEDLSLDPRNARRARVVRPLAEVRTKHWNDGLIITEVDDASLPRLVMLRDSFTSALVPFLAEHFHRAVFYWRSDFDIDTILKEHADVVIMEFGGRKFYQLAAFNPDDVTAAAAPTTRATQR